MGFLMIAALVAMAAGTTMSAYGQYQQAQAANAASRYKQHIAERNAKLAEEQAKKIEAKGKFDANRARIKAGRLAAKQKAAFSDSGVMGTGSVFDVIQSTERLGEDDALAALYSASMSAWAARNQAADYLAQRDLLHMNQRNPGLESAGIMLSGLGQMGASAAAAGAGARGSAARAQTGVS